MNIQVRVLTAQAMAAYGRLSAQQKALIAQSAGADAAMAGLAGSRSKALSKWGNQIQWAGRQLQYNFTLPLLLAGGAATKFALDNEAAMVRVQKVYGDTAMSQAQMLSETEALNKAFVALSDTYGVNQAAVINMAADWAAAGASGVALAKATQLTLQTMVLGEMDAKKATEALIAIQAQYGLSTEDLSKTIDVLNMVENQTGVSMQGLVEGMSRAAGVARSAGVDVRHLAAMIAAMSPAAGSAAQAGNAIKTIFSRLLSPTKEATEVMNLMGINTKAASWQMLNGTQRLEKMSREFEDLGKGVPHTTQALDENGKATGRMLSAQQAVVSSVIASRYQINKFDVLMREMTNSTGFYQKALDSTEIPAKNFNQTQKELNAVLNSNPQRLKQMWTILQNAMADVVQPLLPFLVALAAQVAKLGMWFSNLPLPVQQAVGALALFLVALGPIARYVGSVSTLLGLLGQAGVFFGQKMLGVGNILKVAVLGPVRAVGNAAGGLLGVFTTLGNGLVRAFISPFNNLFIILAMGFRSGWTAFAGSVRTIIGGFGAQMGGLLTASFGAMGASLRAIWVGTINQLGSLIYGGVGRLSSLWAVLGRNMVMSFALIGPNLLRVWSLTGSALLVAVRRLVMTIPILFMNLPGIIMQSIGRLGPALVSAFIGMGPRILAAIRFLGPKIFGIWGLIIGTVLGLIYHFRDDIVKAFGWIVNQSAGLFSPLVAFFQKGVGAIENAFWSLPQGVQGALLTVVKIVQNAALAVYDLFSYFNPFAHHSPSLVENVTAGMAIVRKQYSSIGNTAVFSKAIVDIQRYKAAIGGLGNTKFSDERDNVAKGLKSALPVFDALLGDLAALNRILAVQQTALDAQTAVVDRWKTALDAANAAVDVQQAKLQGLQDHLDSLQSAYDAHSQAMQDFANAPLAGMREMDDQIFANTIAQKKLQLQIAKMGDTADVDKLRNKMSLLQGDIELLGGQKNDLRSAGAGSDITSVYDKQIAGLHAQQDAINKSVGPIQKMQDELAMLQKQAEIMDLEKALKFDPLKKQLSDLIDTSKELTFDEAVAGVRREQAAMALLKPQIDATTAAVNAQKTAVDEAAKSRDVISARYDQERNKLDGLQKEYDRTADSIRNVEDALRSMGSIGNDVIQRKASDARAKAAALKKIKKPKIKKPRVHIPSPGAQNFMDAAGAGFKDPGGTGKLGREGGAGDQSALIDDFTKGITDKLAKTFGNFDLVGPIKKKWDAAWAWIKGTVGPIMSNIGTSIRDFWNNFDLFGGGTLSKRWSDLWSGFVGVAKTAWEWIQEGVKLFAPVVSDIFDTLIEAGQNLWNTVGPELEKFGPIFGNLGKAAQNVWSIIKPLALILGGALLLALRVAGQVIAGVLKPALDMVVHIIGNVIQVIRGLVEVVVGVLSGDWSMAWQGIVDIVQGVFGTIWAIIKGAGQILWAAVWGIVEGIVGFFKWLYDVLVGHSIIPDLINAIVKWFKNMGTWVIDHIKTFVHDAVAWFAALPGKIWDAISSLTGKLGKAASDAFTAFWNKATTIWSNIGKWIGGLPSSAWNAIKDIVTKLGKAGKDAMEEFWTREKNGWRNIYTWITSLPQKAWDGIKSIVTKLGNAGRDAMSAMGSKLTSAWNGARGIQAWIAGLPGRAWTAIKSIATKMGDAGKNAMSALASRLTSAWNGPKGIEAWIKGLPGRVANALSSIGSKVAGGVKTSWNTAADWINTHGINNINKVTEKLGFHLNSLPKFATGGVIPGGVSKKDNMLIAARSGEGVIVPEAVKALGGARGINYLNRAAERGGDIFAQLAQQGRAFRDGGIIDTIKAGVGAGLHMNPITRGASGVGDLLMKGVGKALGTIMDPLPGMLKAAMPGDSMVESFMAGTLREWAKSARSWGNKKDKEMVGPVPGGDVVKRWAPVVQAVLADLGEGGHTEKIPGILRLIAKESGGNPRAINNWDINAINGTPSKGLVQVIDPTFRAYGPRNGKNRGIWDPYSNIYAGLNYARARYGSIQAVDPLRHAGGYDKGGWLQHGDIGVNSSGKPEPVFSSSQWATLSQLVAMSSQIVKQNVTAATGGATGVAGRTMLTLERAQVKADRLQVVTPAVYIQNTGPGLQININGNLEFPNIKNGDDAEEFVKNLEVLTRGK